MTRLAHSDLESGFEHGGSQSSSWSSPGNSGIYPHIHCIATGGGLSLDGTQWISSKPRFFLPVRKRSVVFRGKLLEAFETALTRGRLCMTQRAGRLLLRRAAAQNFVVYSDPIEARGAKMYARRVPRKERK